MLTSNSEPNVEFDMLIQKSQVHVKMQSQNYVTQKLHCQLSIQFGARGEYDYLGKYIWGYENMEKSKDNIFITFFL